MEFFISWYILPIAFLLDLILGDPYFLPHPIRWMGRAITALEPHFRNLGTRLSISGALFAAFLILGTWVLTFVIVKTAWSIHPVLKVFIEIVLIYYCISVRSLEKAAMDVYRALKQNRLDHAKEKVSLIVGRDVDKLTKNGVARATVETVAENLVDGVISPLFFAAIGGAPLAMAYKMVNTLDSMVGYKNEKYMHFGKASARIDDVANFVPARVSVPIIAFAAQVILRNGSSSIETGIREGANHASPNSGYPEAAFAGALGIELAGPVYYRGRLFQWPYIGAGLGEVKTEHIKKACDLMMLSSLFWLFALCGGMVFF